MTTNTSGETTNFWTQNVGFSFPIYFILFLFLSYRARMSSCEFNCLKQRPIHLLKRDKVKSLQKQNPFFFLRNIVRV